MCNDILKYIYNVLYTCTLEHCTFEAKPPLPALEVELGKVFRVEDGVEYLPGPGVSFCCNVYMRERQTERGRERGGGGRRG